MDTGGKGICANADCGEETDCAGENDVDFKCQLRKSNALYKSKLCTGPTDEIESTQPSSSISFATERHRRVCTD